MAGSWTQSRAWAGLATSSTPGPAALRLPKVWALAGLWASSRCSSTGLHSADVDPRHLHGLLSRPPAQSFKFRLAGLAQGLPLWAGPEGRAPPLWAGRAGVRPGRYVSLEGRRLAAHSRRSDLLPLLLLLLLLTPPRASDAWPVSAPPGQAGQEEPSAPRPSAAGTRRPGRNPRRPFPEGGRGREAGRAEGGAPPGSSDRPRGPFGPRAPPEHRSHCPWTSVLFPQPAGPRTSWALVGGPAAAPGVGGAKVTSSRRRGIPHQASLERSPGFPPWARAVKGQVALQGLGVEQLCPRLQELFLAGAFPGGSRWLGTPGKRGPLLSGGPGAGQRAGSVWNQPPQKAWNLRAGPGARVRGVGGFHAPQLRGSALRLFCFPGCSYCCLVGDGAVTGLALRPRVQCSEKACCLSQSQTVQKCPLPCPSLAQAEIPLPWLPSSAPLGLGVPALEASWAPLGQP